MKIIEQELSPQIQFAYDKAKEFVMKKIKKYNVLSKEEVEKIEEAINNIYFKPSAYENFAQFTKPQNLDKNPYTIKISNPIDQNILNHEMMHAASAVLAKEISFMERVTDQNGNAEFKYTAITEGFNNFFAESKEGRSAYIFPEVFAKLLIEKIGEKETFKSFIKGDVNQLAECIQKHFKLKDRKLVFQLFENMDLLVDKNRAQNNTTLLNRTQCMIGVLGNCASIYSKMLANKEYLEGERDYKEVYWKTINDLALDYAITQYYDSAKDEKGNPIKVKGDWFDKFQFLKEDVKEVFLLKDIEKTMNALACPTIDSGNSASPTETPSLKK